MPAAGGGLLDMANELTRAVLPRAAQREAATGLARHPERLQAGGAEVLVESTDRMVADDVLRSGDGKRRDRYAAGQRLELDDAERVGSAGKDEHIRGREMGRQ